MSAIAFWRLVLSLALIFPLFLVTRQWRPLRKLAARDWLWLALAGVALALHFVTWFLSLAYTSVASSTVLVTVHPLYVGLLSALWLREPPSRGEWLAIAIATGGAIWIGWGDLRFGSQALFGDLLASVAALLAAIYFVAGRRLRLRLALWAYVTPVYAIAACFLALSMWIRQIPLVAYDATTWALFAGMAVGPMLFGHTSFNWALRYVRAYVVSLVVLLEPIGATVLAVLILGSAEQPTGSTVTGGAAILLGVALLLRERGQRLTDELRDVGVTS